MRLLQLCKYYHPYRGGVELVSELLTKALQNQGHEVFIAAFGENSQERLGPQSEHIFEFKTQLTFMQAPLSIDVIWNIYNKVKSLNIDIVLVHLPNPVMHELAWLLKKMLGRKIIVKCVFHCDVVNKGILGKIYNAYIKNQMKLYEEIIVSSENLIHSSEVLNCLPTERFKVVPFCTLGLGQFEQRKAFNGHIVAIGRLVAYKGFDFLINAINNSPYKLTIIGDGPCRSQLELLAGPNIKILGSVSDLDKREIMKNASCMVLSSLSNAEAYGMVIAEAFECGLPVVASALPTGVTYLVRDKYNGLLFDTGNSSQLLECLNTLATSDTLLTELSENARSFYHENLSFDAFQKRVAV